MSTVILRCPHCGTTQATAGECDACHESEVRYHCPNHAPGLWLDGPSCAACGATVDRDPRPRPAPPRRETPVPPFGVPRRPTPPAGAGRPTRPRHPLEELLEAARAASRGRGRDPREVGRIEEDDTDTGWRVESPPPMRINPMPVFGCIGGLLRLAMFALILVAMATCGMFGGGGGFIFGALEAPRPGLVVAVGAERD